MIRMEKSLNKVVRIQNESMSKMNWYVFGSIRFEIDTQG